MLFIGYWNSGLVDSDRRTTEFVGWRYFVGSARVGYFVRSADLD